MKFLLASGYETGNKYATWKIRLLYLKTKWVAADAPSYLHFTRKMGFNQLIAETSPEDCLYCACILGAVGIEEGGGGGGGGRLQNCKTLLTRTKFNVSARQRN